MSPKDIDLKIYVDGVTYLALKQRCRDADRTLSEHVRHLIRQDLIKALEEEADDGRSRGGEREGKE